MNNIKNGFSLAETLISSTALVVILTSIANFSGDILSVSYDHTKLIERASQKRFSAERLSDQIKRAVYIYPENQSISLSGYETINTSEAIAMLVPVNPSDNIEECRFIAFHIRTDYDGKVNLYEFSSYDTITWDVGEIPASTYNYFYGLSELISKNVNKDESFLTYTLNNAKTVSDTPLMGVGVSVADPNALIKSVQWEIKIDDDPEYIVNIEGIAKNVPRYIE